MENNIDDNFIDNIGAGDLEGNDGTENKADADTLANKKALEQAQKNLLARKRIDELMEKKRLKELLDDSEDW